MFGHTIQPSQEICRIHIRSAHAYIMSISDNHAVSCTCVMFCHTRDKFRVTLTCKFDIIGKVLRLYGFENGYHEMRIPPFSSALNYICTGEKRYEQFVAR
jgi:hypothetical protein